MSAEQPALRLVDENGELREGGCPECAALRDQLAGAEGEIRSLRARLAQAKRDREAKAHGHRHWPRVLELFGYWKEKCSHPNSRFSVDRFEVAEPIYREYGYDLCKRAIDGAAFDPFTSTRKNGSIKRHDDWDLVFRSRGKFEEFCNRAPLKGKE